MLSQAYAAYRDAEYNKSRSILCNVIKRDPRNDQAQNLMALTEIRTKRFKPAEKRLKRILLGNPEDAIAMVNLSHLYYNIGEAGEALKWARKAWYSDGIEEFHDPTAGLMRAGYMMGLCQLLHNDFDGFLGFDLRFEVGMGGVMLAPRETMWQGEWLGPDSVLQLWGDGGAGDAIQMVRFVPQVKKKSGAKVILCVGPDLSRLFEGLADEVSPTVDRNKPHLPLMSIPYALGLKAENVDGRAYLCRPNVSRIVGSESTEQRDVEVQNDGRPYLLHRQANDEDGSRGVGETPARSLEELPRTNGKAPKVGLCWRGRQDVSELADRSIPTELLKPLREVFGGAYRCLQYGEEGFTPEDFLETAQAISECDLVISIDTSVAHLAASMGIPTWLMLRYQGDWRWPPIDKSASRWYDCMKVYRQSQYGNWKSVIDPILSDLKERLHA